MKSQKGISLVALIITIIVIIILSAIFIRSAFTDKIDQAAETRRVNEMIEVYDAVVQRGIEHRIDPSMYPYIGTPISGENVQSINGSSYGDEYYKIETEEHKRALGLERVLDSYIVSYATGEVVSEIPIKVDDKVCYTLADVSIASQGIEAGTPVIGEYDEEGKVNKPILSNGMVPVKYSGGDWVITTENDSDWYDYATGRYANIMLMDELTTLTASNEKIRKMSRAELNSLAGDKVVIQGSTFVWIPRYTYKYEGTQLKIVYSNLINDYTDDDYIKNPAFYYGGYAGANGAEEPNSGYYGGGKELTGIWVSKYEAGYNQ